jgi:hypothetical protein
MKSLTVILLQVHYCVLGDAIAFHRIPCSTRISASGITDASHRGYSLALSLSFTNGKTRSSLSVCRSWMHPIAMSSVTWNEPRLRSSVSRITTVSCLSSLTLVMLMVTPVSSSFDLSITMVSTGLILSTIVVAVLLLLAGDGNLCKVSLYSWRLSYSGPSGVIISLSSSLRFWTITSSLVMVFA